MMKTEDLLKKGINNLSIRKTIKPPKKVSVFSVRKKGKTKNE